MALARNKAIERQFLSFINSEQLFSQTDCILLAISGGVDSVVMAELFRSAGFRFGIAHVNFQLRGADSESDEAFVKALAERYSVRFHTVRLPPEQQAGEWGISTQMAARQLRYDWFEQIAADFGYDRIATAHHQDDVFETILLNLVRGTGLTGLRGIPIRQGQIVRPIWFASRKQIEDYALEHQLQWREDSSNLSDKYRRNQLRHQVIPILKEMNPSLLRTLQTTIARLNSAEVLVDQEIEWSWKNLAKIRPEGVFISIQDLDNQSELAFRLLKWLKPYGFQYVQIGPIVEAIRSTGFGQTFYSTTHQVIRDREFLIIEPLQPSTEKPTILTDMPTDYVPASGQYDLHFEMVDKPGDFQMPLNQHTVFLDADRIQWPLTIRRWQPGDRFRPLGMKGSQTVGNYLTNKKVSIAERRFARVLVSDNQIIWLIGYRPDDRFRISDRTRRILKIEQVLIG